MAYPIVQTAQCTPVGGVSTITASFATLPSAGNAVIAVGYIRGNTTITSITDNATTPNTLGSVVNLSNAGNAIEIASVLGVGATSGTYTVTLTCSSTGVPFLFIFEVQGLTATDQTGSIQGLSTGSSATVTTSSADVNAYDFVVSGVGSDGGSVASGLSNPPTSSDGFTWTTQWFEDNFSNNTFMVTSQVVSSIVTPNATYNYTTANTNFNFVIASFKGPPPPAILSGYSSAAGLGPG